jgi:hypothetical protein
MKGIRNCRLRVPLLLLAWGGAVAAVDAIVGKGGAAVAAAVLTIPVAAGWYAWSGRDSDFGALAGGRADERQALIRTRARALSGTAMYAAAAIGGILESALRATDHLSSSYWSFSLVVVIGAVSYRAGLRRYGARGEDDPGPGDDREQRAPEPILTWWGGNRRVTS